jgi:hypothetical protein
MPIYHDPSSVFKKYAAARMHTLESSRKELLIGMDCSQHLNLEDLANLTRKVRADASHAPCPSQNLIFHRLRRHL